ncbi:MAG: hypothetical protein KF705_10920, partial [Phycisphaeraceae bacterium]|nr:hypothetical protein [Phycisphaeraceae bacterium]
ERRISLDGRVVEVSNPDQLRIDLKDTSIAHVPDALHSGPWICDPLPEPGAVQHTERYSVNAKQRRFKLHIHFRRHPPRQPYPETPEPLPPHRSLSRNECWLIHSITTESV